VMLWLASYVLLAVGAIRNVRLPAMPLVVLGLCANLAAIVANGGHMPVLPAAMRAAGFNYDIQYNSAAIAQPHLAALVDRFVAPDWIPRANVFSVGDVALAIGGVVLPLALTGALGRLRAGTARAYTSLRAAL
jgi:Family of unknown function (DUF5317)